MCLGGATLERRARLSNDTEQPIGVDLVLEAAHSAVERLLQAIGLRRADLAQVEQPLRSCDDLVDLRRRNMVRAQHRRQCRARRDARRLHLRFTRKLDVARHGRGPARRILLAAADDGDRPAEQQQMPE